VAIFLFMTWFGSHPYWVEKYYSTGLYPYLAVLLRGLFCWIPFSMGDVFYLVAGIWLFAGLVVLIRRLIKREWDGRQWLGWGRRMLEAVLIILIVFNGFWGLNYNRLGIAYQLKLQPENYSEAALQSLIDTLTIRVNENRLAIGKNKATTRQVIFPEAYSAYGQIDTTFSFLHYPVRSVKVSLYGTLGNYLGFLGYYNPFTGEAQVNNTVPRFSIPYTTCHEMAHQLGYASESEANFVGYLAAVHSTDTLFRYSTYFDLFTYANREMFFRDSTAARQNYKRLDTLVKMDYRELVLFLRAHRNPLEPVLNRMYDGYLKANHQAKGIESYDEVTGWLMAYGKRYGRL